MRLLAAVKAKAIQTLRAELPRGWSCPALLGVVIASVTSPRGTVIYRIWPGGKLAGETPGPIERGPTREPYARHPSALSLHAIAAREGDETVLLYLLEGNGRSVPDEPSRVVRFEAGLDRGVALAVAWILRDARERYQAAGLDWTPGKVASANRTKGHQGGTGGD